MEGRVILKEYYQKILTVDPSTISPRASAPWIKSIKWNAAEKIVERSAAKVRQLIYGYPVVPNLKNTVMWRLLYYTWMESERTALALRLASTW